MIIRTLKSNDVQTPLKDFSSEPSTPVLWSETQVDSYNYLIEIFKSNISHDPELKARGHIMLSFNTCFPRLKTLDNITPQSLEITLTASDTKKKMHAEYVTVLAKENKNMVQLELTKKRTKVTTYSHFKINLSKFVKIKNNGIAIAPLKTDRLDHFLRLESDKLLEEYQKDTPTASLRRIGTSVVFAKHYQDNMKNYMNWSFFEHKYKYSSKDPSNISYQITLVGNKLSDKTSSSILKTRNKFFEDPLVDIGIASKGSDVCVF